MSSPGRVRLDLNNLEFQQQLFDLEKVEQRRVLVTLRKLSKMTWNQVYSDTGLKWEAVASATGPHGCQVYSMRMGKALRAVAFRVRTTPQAPVSSPRSRLRLPRPQPVSRLPAATPGGSGRDMGAVAADMEQVISAVPLPLG